MHSWGQDGKGFASQGQEGGDFALTLLWWIAYMFNTCNMPSLPSVHAFLKNNHTRSCNFVIVLLAWVAIIIYHCANGPTVNLKRGMCYVLGGSVKAGSSGPLS